MNHHVTYTPANLCFQSVAPVCSEINECQGDTLLLAIHVPPCLMLLYNFHLFTILMPFVWCYALQLFFSRFWEQQPHIFAFVHLKQFASSAEPLRIVVMNMTEKETCTSITLLFSHKKPCAFPQIPKQGWAINLPKGSCEKLGPLGKWITHLCYKHTNALLESDYYPAVRDNFTSMKMTIYSKPHGLLFVHVA